MPRVQVQVPIRGSVRAPATLLPEDPVDAFYEVFGGDR